MRGAALLAVVLAAVLAACAPRMQAPGPDAGAPRPPAIDETVYLTPDGVGLPLRRWEAAGEPEAVVLALHGFNDYSNAFAGVGPWLADQGVSVFAYDQRGFGAAPRPGRWPGAAVLMSDARAALAALRAAYPDTPVYALGESMGGAVLMSAWAEEPLDVDGLILVAPAVWGRATMPFYQTAGLWLFAHTVPWLPLTARGIKRHPSDNIPMLRALARDPLVIKETRVDAVWGVVDLMDRALAAAPALDARALILLGRHDDIVPPPASLRMLEGLPAAGSSRRTVAVYRSGYHMLLRDLKSGIVWGDILSWIRYPGEMLPSGADRNDPQEALLGGGADPDGQPSPVGLSSSAAEFMQ